MRRAMVFVSSCILVACARSDEDAGAAASVAAAASAVPYPADPEEPRLHNLRRLTDGGENAEAYFSADGTQLIFQSNRPPDVPCDQIYIMNIDGSDRRLVSTGRGRTTCAYFFSGAERILFSSTHLGGEACPAPPDYSRGYVWPLDDYDIFTAAPDGSDVRRLTDTPGYDAEATISRDGTRIVFTSMRDGDLDLYVMNADGSNVQRLTEEVGYDGGAFFSPDGAKIVYRAHHPTDRAELEDYRQLLAAHLIRPGELDIWIMNADGTEKRRVAELPGADFGPFFHPSGQKIIFSSNLHDPAGRNFDLYLINIDGTGLERVTVHEDFDGFPMFSPDGTKLVFASNRGAAREGDTNIFLADWVETLPVR